MTERLLLALLVLAPWCRAEIIDRVAVTAGARAITWSDVMTEIRLSAFLGRTEPDFGPASRRTAAERLVDRALAEIEMEIGKYPEPQEAEVSEQVEAFRKQHFPTREAWEQALAASQVGEEDLRLYLLRQLAVVRFIDARFAPGVQVPEEDLRAYHQGPFAREWESKTRQPLPPLDEVRSGIEEILRAQRVDALLDEWLREARQRTRIQYRPEAFQ